jgi:Ca-activated chloride channel homolog
MISKTTITFAVLFHLSLTLCAQGVILPHPHRPIPGPAPDRPLRLKSTQLEVTIRDQVAETHVAQIFVNDHHFPVEGTYIFPIPPGAAFKEFAIWENGKRLKGEVLEKEEARRIYLDILRTWRDPGLLEYMGENRLQARIFPIPPHSEKKIELSYSETLKKDNEFTQYLYPLGRGCGLTSAPPDLISGVIDVRTSRDLKTLFAPSTRLDVNRKGERHAIAGFELRKPKQPEDLLLYFSTSEDEIGLSLLTERRSGEAGYFLLSITPRFERPSRSIAKEVVFVLDTSGSMQEAGKMEKARAALRFGLGTLGRSDSFNIVSFATSTRLFRERTVPAEPDAVEAALDYVSNLEAGGGTNFADALKEGLAVFSSAGDRPRYLVVLTDGLPTVGETDPARILKSFREKRPESVRLFTFGVGYDVNTFLLDRLADENRGTSAYVRPEEDLEFAMSGFFKKISEPVLTDLRLELRGLDAFDLHPHQPQDLFHGSQILVLGRFRGQGSATVILTGRMGGLDRRIEYPVRETAGDGQTSVLDRLWAQRKVAFLLDQIRLNGESGELKSEVIALARRYGFVTPYTSYLAIEDDALLTTSGRQDRTARAPAYVSGVAGAVPVGEAAVNTAIGLQEMKTSEELQDTVGFRRIDGKDFVQRNGEWVDTSYKPESRLPEKIIRARSDEYFELVTKAPELARFLSLGDKVTVVWKGAVYKVTP